MVKRARVVEAAEQEAEVAYEQTRLAARAKRARTRLAALTGLGAMVATIEAFATGRYLWLAPALALAATAWGVRRGGLGSAVAAGFAAVLAVSISLWGALATSPSPSDLIAWLVALVLGAAALPDVVVLLRDAELQHAYGRWARRDP